MCIPRAVWRKLDAGEGELLARHSLSRVSRLYLLHWMLNSSLDPFPDPTNTLFSFATDILRLFH